MSVNEHLKQLASDLVLSDTEKSSISTSITTLSTRLNAYFNNNLITHFQFGSSVSLLKIPFPPASFLLFMRKSEEKNV